jgi:hypothetical protein
MEYKNPSHMMEALSGLDQKFSYCDSCQETAFDDKSLDVQSSAHRNIPVEKMLVYGGMRYLQYHSISKPEN